MSEKIDKCEKKSTVDDQYQMSTQDYFRMALMSSLGLYLRIMKLGFPRFITDTELEVSRHVNWYMAGKFFIGKFPPLMGILSTGLARLVGYYGTEDLIYAGQ
jgi:dolichyl-phosphate-mannose--protein O-mannosyl transferase